MLQPEVDGGLEVAELGAAVVAPAFELVRQHALVALQQKGLVRLDSPLQLAQFIWALVHGVAMLTIDGKLGPQAPETDEMVRYAVSRIRTGIAS